MAINIKELLAHALLDNLKHMPLDKITITRLLDDTGISRQSFYNHFRDKNDLIVYIYEQHIIPSFSEAEPEMDFYRELLISLQNMQKYRDFMIQALLMEGQNNLKDYLSDHCTDFDLEYHQKLYGERPMPETLRLATVYHARASSAMTISWILADMPASCEEFADLITRMRALGMEELFKDAEHKGNPYRR